MISEALMVGEALARCSERLWDWTFLTTFGRGLQ